MSVIINGTSGISTDGGSELFGSGSIGGSLTLTSGTANGVTYLNGSKVLTSGSALTFDGSTLDVTGTVTADGLTINNTAPYITFKDTDTTDNVTGYLDFRTSADVQKGFVGFNGAGDFELNNLNNNGINFSSTNVLRANIASNGDISFYEDTGTTPKFFWDASTESLGIGTSSPSSKLVVGDNATTTIKPTVAITDATNGASISLRGQSPILSFDVTSAGVPKILMDGAGIEFKTGTLDAQGDVDLKLDSSGNLGLGVTPSAWGSYWRAINFGYTSGIGQLAATSTGSGEVSLVSSAYNNNTNWLYYYTGAQPSKYSQTSGQHQWFTAGAGTAGNAISFTQAMTLDASGNLGIGTSSPAKKLELYSSQNANVELLRLNNPDVNGLGTQIGFTQGSTTYSQIVSEYSSGWRIKIGAGVPTGTTAGDAGYLTFFTNNGSSSYAERMRITSSGNVGIGTSSPGAKLSVAAGGNAWAIALTGAGTGSQSISMANTGATVEVGINGSTAGAVFTDSLAYAQYLFTQYNGVATPAIQFAPNATAAMTILANGNVGIGTSSPVSTAKTSIKQAAGGGVGSTQLHLEQSNTTDGYDLKCDSADGALAFLRYASGSATERMRIDASGNLKFNSGYGSVATAYGCRAWVNFNGTGTVAIRASGNVSSITDVSTGRYVVNFATAMPDGSYSANANASKGPGTESESNSTGIFYREDAVYAGSLEIYTMTFNGSYADRNNVMVTIFR